jgi:hypothetical protein
MPQKKSISATYQRNSVLIRTLSQSPDHLVEKYEGHAAEKHEQDDNPVKIGIVVVPDAGIPGRVSGRGHGAESVAQ